MLLSGNMISRVGEVGIKFDSSNTNVIVDGNTISDVALDAVSFSYSNRGLTITNNVISGTVGDDAFGFEGFGNVIVDGAGNTAAGATLTGGGWDLLCAILDLRRGWEFYRYIGC